jgi:hypothetical protein
MAPMPPQLVPDEEAVESRREPYTALLARLSHQSVVKHFDAYADVPWDEPGFEVDPEDARWIQTDDGPLGRTPWYRSRTVATQARINCHLIATSAKVGAQFENVLQRGLLEFAMRLPNHSPEFRYAYHETIEEGQHSLMFQELVNRSGFDIPGLSRLDRLGSRLVIRTARTFPELFFMFVLGGEDPIDYAQRTTLKSGRELPPIIKRIMQIHVTEEARHLCFARTYLTQHVPRLGPIKRFILTVRTPVILGVMYRMMLNPSAQVIRSYDIPKDVVDAAYTRNAEHHAFARASLAKVRALCTELGLITPLSARLWRSMGIMDATASA